MIKFTLPVSEIESWLADIINGLCAVGLVIVLALVLWCLTPEGGEFLRKMVTP